jgi:hypothetical protein
VAEAEVAVVRRDDRHQFTLALSSAARYSRTAVVSAAYTSQRCSACGQVDPKPLESQAVFRCATCQYGPVHADMNAAKNILAAGLAVIACEDNARLAGRAAPPKQETARNCCSNPHNVLESPPQLWVGRQRLVVSRRPMTAGIGSRTTLVESAVKLLTSGFRFPVGYGVIGNTADSGSAILGSSPGTPASIALTCINGRHPAVQYAATANLG